jgi:glycosyltransferase involved in cell wall biosynthesis
MSLKRHITAAARYLSPTAKRRIRRAYRMMQRPIQLAPQARFVMIDFATYRRDHERAARLAAKAVDRRPTNPQALGRASRIAMRRGEVSAAASYATRRARTTKRPTDWLNARHTAGRMRDTDARWQPIINAERPAPPDSRQVLYIAKESRPYLHNGFCTRTHETLQALTSAGQDISAVTMPGFPGVIGVDDAPTHTRTDDVVYHHLLPRSGHLVKRLAFDEYVDLSAQVLSGFVSRHRPAMLHVGSGHRGFETALAGTAVARWAGIPWIYEVRSFFETTWTADAKYREQGEYYHRRFATETRMMHAADLVITLSGPMRDEIAEKHGVPPERIRVVPNAVDLERFTPRVCDADLRGRLGLDGSYTIGYVSNLSHPREGQEVLIAAVAKLRRQGHTVSGLLVGDGTRLAELSHLAHKLGVREHVVFTGSVPFDQVADYYAQIDLFVVPRINERAARLVSPMKPFEAMAMNIPVLVADLPALVEIADNGVRAETFRAEDSESLAKAVAGLMNEPDRVARLVENAANWVQKERAWSTVSTAFSSAYAEVLSAPHPLSRKVA